MPLAQVTTCLAPQNAASSASSARTSGPMMNWQCASTRATASSIDCAEPAALRGNVDEGDGIGAQVLVHGALQRIDASMDGSADDAARPLARGERPRAWRALRGSGWRFRGWRRPPRR